MRIGQLVVAGFALVIYSLNALNEFLRIINKHFLSVRKIFILDGLNAVFALIIAIIERKI